MIWLQRLLILCVSGTIFNVWFLRSAMPTAYRGANASSLKEEFIAYGLGEVGFYLIGAIKLLAALGLLIGLFWEKSIRVSAMTVALLMSGAIAMHLKVADPLMRSVPAITLLLLSIGIIQLAKKR